MKLLKTLGLALCLASLFITLSSKAQTLNPGQVYTTGNIVLDTPQGGPTPWTGGVYQDSLTCWYYGDPGYCGPNAIVRPGNNINFSYGSTYLYQQQAIASVLPNSGTGLQVSGYNFSFTAKNGNGWDDGRTDSLMALVRFWDSTGGRGANNLLYGNVYNLNYNFNWTTFNYSENFTTPLAVPTIGQVQYGFIGRDNNFWAGPYGPEINSVSFSLKYSVDPCATNILSSPSCPGYFEAISKLSTPVATASVVTEAPALAPAPMYSESITNNLPGQPPLSSGPVPAGNPAPQETAPPPPPPPQAGPAPAGAPAPGLSQQASAAQPSANNPQPKAGEVNDSGGSSKPTVSLSSVLSMINSNQDKTSALEKSVVQAADAQAFSAGEAAKQQAEKTAGDAQSQSIASSGSSSSSSQASGMSTSLVSAPGSAQAVQMNPQMNNAANTSRLQQSASTSTMQLEAVNNVITVQQQNILQNSIRQELSVTQVVPAVSYSLFTPTRNVPQVQYDTPLQEGVRFGHKSPVESAMEEKPVLPQMSSNSQQNDTVKKNVQNNEAAGNVTIESIAKQPANYAQYFTIIPDVAFYAPKEIYKNQKTIDNARALRQLSSDRLHQDLVNLQYK